MKIAPPTDNEEDRLKALYDYDVLDTEAEKIFDDITQLASQICQTPITLISLVDPDRQWFKSKVGLDATETSRDIAFCAHAIHQEHVFEVEDTLEDERFFDNPLVTSAPNIRFYAGTPLITHSGLAIGTLCVIDKKPNKLTEAQRQALEVLGRSVISQMELRKTNKQLVLANEHKTEFLSNMSHELRTPLNAIIGFSRLMLDELNTSGSPEKFSEYLGHIDHSGRRLLNVVNSVIDLNKIEAGKMQAEIVPTEMRQFVHDLQGMLNIQAQSKDLELLFKVTDKVPKVLDIDHVKISQIITNLVHNAIKFTDSKKWVKAEFSYDGQNLSITVADQGVGISAEDQAKLFTKFQQVGNSKSSEGSGLGLAITRSLVVFLKGKINLISTLGQGTIFKVQIPAQASRKDPVHSSSIVATETFNKSSKILLVEDNEINQMVMLATFESLGMTITLASTGEEAVELAQSVSFDLIFMDIHLPGINGIEAAGLIRKSCENTPIVALSADAFSQSQRHSLWDEYLCKPLEKEKLLLTLNRFIPAVNTSL
jgi:signal transduction histidine kinase/ActR/RegA family two-component response regulator